MSRNPIDTRVTTITAKIIIFGSIVILDLYSSSKYRTIPPSDDGIRTLFLLPIFLVQKSVFKCFD